MFRKKSLVIVCPGCGSVKQCGNNWASMEEKEVVALLKKNTKQSESCPACDRARRAQRLSLAASSCGACLDY